MQIDGPLICAYFFSSALFVVMDNVAENLLEIIEMDNKWIN